MYETVTIDEAIRKGKRMVSIPSILILVTLPVIGGFGAASKILPDWLGAACFFTGILFAWLYWSVTISKWRIWAFENVRNVHELKRRAIDEQLIWPDNSFFGKTEIRTADQKMKWASLLSKFEIEDEFHDDFSKPSETIIYYSKGKNFIEMAIMLLFAAGGIYILLKTDRQIIGGALTVFGAFMAFREFKEATNTDPQIILNEEGIQTSKTVFYSWSQVSNEWAVREGSGKHTRFYLTYDHPTGSEKMNIQDLETNQKKLNDLLKVYRGRFHQKQGR